MTTQAEHDKQRAAAIAATEKHMRALHAQIYPDDTFEHFVNRFAMDLWSLGEDLKARSHKNLDAERKRVFEMVQDKQHWKNPIRCTLDSLSEADEKLLHDAVVFYTGSVPTIVRQRNGKVKVLAAGYYNTIGV